MKNIKQLITYLVALASRFVGLPANLSPMGSLGFFGGNGYLFAVIVIVHDYLRGGFYPGFWLTYVGFASYLILGRVAGDRWRRQLFLLPFSSLLFFVFSNLGVWWYWYPHTLSSLVTCFVLALPFYRNTFIGDIVFGYGYILLKNYRPKFQVNHQTSLHAISTTN